MNLSQEKQLNFPFRSSMNCFRNSRNMSAGTGPVHAPSIFESKFGGTAMFPTTAPFLSMPKPAAAASGTDRMRENPAERLPAKGLQFWIYDDDLSGADFDHPTVQNGFRILYHESVDPTVTEAGCWKNAALSGRRVVLSGGKGGCPETGKSRRKPVFQ
ncbi:MAG: DUF1963 domain-containing protein [Ruminococcus sp.]